MKTITYPRFPRLVIFICLCIFQFSGCEPDGGDDIIECAECEEEEDPQPTLRKPNIYIYPTENIQLAVDLYFPVGGEVIKSIPEYGNGWDVNVDTTGLIDNTYWFLFYESTQPDNWQRNTGWIIDQTELEDFFVNNMKEYGFRGQEIIDFIEYWIPRLKKYEHYYIYPQTSEIINTIVDISFSHLPDNVLRLFYMIEGCDQLSDKDVIEPKTIKTFERKGFFVTEWGVIY